MKRLLGWVVAYLFRWLPHSVETGLRAVGQPGENAPVLVTGNFSLTVTRVLRALRGLDLWLLVASSDGINVWCAACGGTFTHHRVIDAVKTSMLSEKVRHRQLILPPLTAAAMDLARIREETGFRARFGPVYASDIPAYLQAGRKKTEAMRRARFDLSHRLDMILSMNVPVYLILATLVMLLCPECILGATLLFWGAVLVLYLLVHRIPGRTGWAQGLIAASFLVVCWAGLDWITRGDPFGSLRWFAATFAIFWLAAFDLAGIVSPRKSDAERLAVKLGLKRIGKIFRDKHQGTLTLLRPKCSGCRTCEDLCPLGVFADPDPENKITFRDRTACFHCGACVMQCPEGALCLKR